MASLIFLCFTLSLYPYLVVSLASSNVTAVQMQAILSFKDMVSDPSGSLLSWNSSNLCRWRGVGCSRKHHERIVLLNLNSFGLIGGISPLLGNLSYLRVLNLGMNQLVGQIPSDLSRLRRLRVLNLTMNSLQGVIPTSLRGCTELTKLSLANNHLQGEIPGELGALKNLVTLNLQINGLSGKIPGELGALRNLVFLSLSSNSLSRNIPSSLGNLSSLIKLNLSNNSLSGPIPTSLGNLSNLTNLLLWLNHLSGVIPSSLGWLSNLVNLDLEVNNLTGSIPPAIWNISSLVLFAVSTNELTGTLPPNAFSKLSLLEVFTLGQNNFHGEIPSSLMNATSLLQFEILLNYFTGTIPPKLGGLQSLQSLVLANNYFEAKNHHEWEFIQALTNCSQLYNLELDSNTFSGMFPSAASNLTTTLEILSLTNNKIAGHMPREIGNLVGLTVLDLFNNYLTGSLPSSLSMLQNLVDLRVQNNILSGPVPPFIIGNLTQLNTLSLGGNSFSGVIPSNVGNMVSLLELDLHGNNFTGTVPSSLFNITTLSIFLDISYNHLEGPIPLEIGNLQNLLEFDASFNQLSGEIPFTVGKCQLIQIMYIGNNSLKGNIPSLLSELKALEILDLSSNNLSGPVPEFLGDFSTLYYLNLSFNSFEGKLPTNGVFANATGISALGNSMLCGGILPLHLPPCSLQISKKKHKFPTLVLVLSLVATIVCIVSFLTFFLAYHKRRSTKRPSTVSMQGHKLVSYQQLAQATDGFSITNLLGIGSHGSVYRANLHEDIGEEEKPVAVKVLKLQTPGALKSFTSECKALRNLRHRNLVKIITVCSSIDFSGNDFKAIVFDFMPNGSLEEWLHRPNTNNQTEERHLSLAQIVSILFDVAYALDYLHYNGAAPIVHCDLKPSNVLLDSDMVAHVGDFGLAKILAEGCSNSQPSTNSMGFRGTIGYAPPEYGAGNMVSTHGDIYSYGILILEMITGKRPTDNMFDQGLSLRDSVEMALDSTVLDNVDAELVKELENGPATEDDPTNQRKVDSLISLLKLGMLCSENTPSSRISSKDIIKELHAIKG